MRRLAKVMVQSLWQGWQTVALATALGVFCLEGDDLLGVEPRGRLLFAQDTDACIVSEF